jgi:UDP-N-acetylmuramoyl-tripeptide--D-alanyl-D-alanine ligase
MSLSPELLQHLLDLFHQHPSVNTDTRKVQTGDLFVALRGDRFDGNAYAANALEAGAAVAVVDNPAYFQPQDERYVLVPDSLLALQELARARRRELDIPILGITGSNGKTTTKELIHSILSQEKRVFATKGNFNNHIGVPLTLLGIPNEVDIAIVEMGANQPGDIAELAHIAEPTHGLITNVGHAHLEKLSTLDGVRATKGALFDIVIASGGLLFVNEADPHVLRAAKPAWKRVGFGMPDSDYWMEVVAEGLLEMQLRVHHADWEQPLELSAQLTGRYNAQNILAAVVIGDFFGISPAGIQAGISSYRSENNRSQILEKDGFTFWLDAYNANISSMEASVRNIFQLAQGRPVALVLGDMLEMGTEEAEIHARLGRIISEFSPHVTLCIGPRMKHCYETAPTPKYWYESVAEALPNFWKHLQGTELVLIKGSRGMALERLVE